MELNSPDPRALTVGRISAVIFSVVVGIVALVASAVFVIGRWRFDAISALVVSGSLVIPALLLWLSYVWCDWEYRASFWRLDPEGFEVRKGVFWQHRISVPLARVQHVDVSQGPLQRRFGLATLTIHTAGTGNASVVFEGLDHQEAMSLKDRLVAQKEAIDVV